MDAWSVVGISPAEGIDLVSANSPSDSQ
jgi:hypothetical protein